MSSDASVNNKNDILKIFAIIGMLIDHIGQVFFPSYVIFRIIGRIAFPIFAYQVSRGFIYSSNIKKYMLRLFGFAIISQIPYVLLAKTEKLNVLFTLLISILLLNSIKNKNKYCLFFVPVVLLVIALLSPIEYGIFGISLPCSFYLFDKNRKLSLVAQLILILGYTFMIHWHVQLFCFLGSILVLYYPAGKPVIKINKYFFYIFYPAHLTVLALIKWLK